MLFKDIPINGFFVFNEDMLCRKIPDPQPLPFGGKCRDCGDETPWNARDVEYGCLAHFCPEEEVNPAGPGLDRSNQGEDTSAERGILVKYTAISGEAEFCCTALIPWDGSASPEEAVDGYFSDFFFDGTVREGRRYYSGDCCRAVQVDSWVVAPPEDYAVLKQYI